MFWAVIAILVVQISVTIAGTVVADRHMDSAELDGLGSVGELTAAKVEGFADVGVQAVAAASAQFELSDGEPVFPYTAAAQASYLQLSASSSLEAMFIAYPDGSFYVLQRTGTWFTSLSRRGESDTVTETVRGPQFGIVTVTTRPFTASDAREREWYSVAAASDHLEITAPYVDAATGVSIVSAVNAVRGDDGEIAAVIGADLSADELSAVLSDLPYGEETEAFLVTTDGTLVSAPTERSDEVASVIDETGSVPELSALGVQIHDGGLVPGGVAAREDSGHLSLAYRLSEESGLPWVIQIATTDGDVSGAVVALRGTLLWATAATTVIAVAMVVLTMLGKGSFFRLHRAASSDPLTGLSNRPALLLRGRDVAGAHARNGGQVIVCVLDLDNFKTLNDVCGHVAGDEALVGVSAALRSWIRVDEVAARVGGDEFVVLLHRRAQDDARCVAAELRDVVSAALVRCRERGLGVGVTVGVAVHTSGRLHVEELIEQADAALVEGKQASKGSVYLAGE
ncbi:sensor domain-containing diguanylate cyclase [Demequina sp. NBRC 110057]|uniref:sensor domain-containing diguanylate cyclase n=1 Tax=Demequina sp. NBRC 110057 TaxID=1570346 RepID=UPI0013564BE2|nr:sensor domain-containing diguanylate cyclase [Demequina sp. NBRC 110057]